MVWLHEDWPGFVVYALLQHVYNNIYHHLSQTSFTFALLNVQFLIISVRPVSNHVGSLLCTFNMFLHILYAYFCNFIIIYMLFKGNLELFAF